LPALWWLYITLTEGSLFPGKLNYRYQMTLIEQAKAYMIMNS